MTNQENLNKILDKIIAENKKENIQILAGRMRNDTEFQLDTLSLFTTICFYDPSLLVILNEQVALLTIINTLIFKKDQD